MEGCLPHCNMTRVERKWYTQSSVVTQDPQCSCLILQYLMPYELIGMALCIRNNFATKFQFYLA